MGRSDGSHPGQPPPPPATNDGWEEGDDGAVAERCGPAAAAVVAAAAAAVTTVVVAARILSPRVAWKSDGAEKKREAPRSKGGARGNATRALAPHFEISMSDLEILEAVGEGGFCRVHKARFVRDKSTVAVKKLKGIRAPDPKVLESFTKEIELHSRIRHPHVIQFFGGCTQPPDLCLVTEFMFCSLQHALDHDPAAFHPQFEVETALCVALGLNHLHCLKIIHRDLKASNVLVDRNYCNPKIADFGLSRVKLAIGETMTRGVGSPFAMAPEMFTSNSYTQAVDWYAFGVLVWQIVTKKHPYVGMKQMDIINHVVQQKKRLPSAMRTLTQSSARSSSAGTMSPSSARLRRRDVALEEMVEILEAVCSGRWRGAARRVPGQLGGGSDALAGAEARGGFTRRSDGDRGSRGAPG